MWGWYLPGEVLGIRTMPVRWQSFLFLFLFLKVMIQELNVDKRM